MTAPFALPKGAVPPDYMQALQIRVSIPGPAHMMGVVTRATPTVRYSVSFFLWGKSLWTVASVHYRELRECPLFRYFLVHKAC